MPDQLVTQILERISLLQLHVDAVDLAEAHTRDPYYRSLDVHSGNLRQVLMELELNEWRHLFMYSMVVDKDTLETIKRAAMNRFVDDHCEHTLFPGDTDEALRKKLAETYAAKYAWYRLVSI